MCVTPLLSSGHAMGQLHFVTAIAVKGTADQQMTGQLHLADHAYLRKAGIAMLVTGGVVTRTVFGCIGRSPDDTIDSSKRNPAQVGWPAASYQLF